MRPSMAKPTFDLVARIFVLDAENGRLFWKEPPHTHPRLKGVEAGCPRRNHHGKIYWTIKIHGKAHRRSQIIFLMVNGYWPSPTVDHEDGNSLNDRPYNLRQATVTQNAWNHRTRAKKSSLPMGIRELPSGNFEARIGFQKTQIRIGVFPTKQQAVDRYKSKRKELYGQFA